MLRIFLLVFSVCVFINSSAFADVPQTVDPSLIPLLPDQRDRGTCDPEFEEVIKNRAWLEAQREITQNANLIARPDSVLAVSCFDSFMDHLGAYAGYIYYDPLAGLLDIQNSGNFPSRPRESYKNSGLQELGFLQDILADLLPAFFAPESGTAAFMGVDINNIGAVAQGAIDTISNIISDPAGGSSVSMGGELALLITDHLGEHDPYLSNGFFLYSTLEILVLDQLENNVSTIGNVVDVIGPLALCLDFENLSAEAAMNDYLEDNFPDYLLGGRAKPENTGPPNWSQITPEFGTRVERDNYTFSCNRMNQVWRRAKCYDFATESVMDVTPPVAPETNRDGFYSLEEYKNLAGIDEDYRNGHGTTCKPVGDTLIDLEGLDWENALGHACNVAAHGIPGVLGAINLPLSQKGPTWDEAFIASDPDPSTPGAADAYNHYLGQVGPTSATTCSDPVKTGYVVRRNGNEYYDAICPNPGCWFNPPSSLSGTGSCTQ